jgi:hypothetical protein
MLSLLPSLPPSSLPGPITTGTVVIFLLVEREKYRHAVFSEKLKAYREIAEAEHRFRVHVGKLLYYLDPAVSRIDDFKKEFPRAFELARELKITLDRHIFLIPDDTINRITFRKKPCLPKQCPVDLVECKNVLEEYIEASLGLIDILRNDLGINEFAKKLKI